MDGSHDNKWFVYMNDHHEGPFSMATLQAKLQSGEFNRTQYVWREGMSDWQPVSQVRELDSLFTPPAAPGSVAPPSDQGPVFDGKLSDIRDSEKGEPSFNITIDSGSVLTANEKEAENQRTIETLQEDHFNKIVINSSEVLTESFHPVPDMAEQAPPRRSSGFLKIFLLIAIIVVSTFGLMSGAFNPLLKNSRFASTASFLQDLGRPPFTKLAQWIPQLQSWISPIPSLPGVPESEMKELYRLSRQSDPPGLAVGMSKTDSTSPSFYISSSLPNGAKFDLTLVGVPETLISQTSLVIKSSADMNNKLASFPSLRQADGRPLPQGEYRIYITEADANSQPQLVESVLSTLPSRSEMLPTESEVQGPRRLFLQKTYFLGGERDESYSKRLKDFHDRLRSRSQEELVEVGDILQKLTSQLSATIDEYKKQFGGKPSKNAEKKWNEFHEKWTGSQTQLEQGFSGWAESINRKEFFHWGLYQLIRTVSEKISQLHVQQHSGVLIRPNDVQEFQTQLAEKQKAAQESLSSLESKITESRQLNESGEGMPRRLNFSESAPTEDNS